MPNKQTTREERAKEFVIGNRDYNSDFEEMTVFMFVKFANAECAALEKEYGEALRVCTDNIKTYEAENAQQRKSIENCHESVLLLQDSVVEAIKKHLSLTAALEDARDTMEYVREGLEIDDECDGASECEYCDFQAKLKAAIERTGEKG